MSQLMMALVKLVPVTMLALYTAVMQIATSKVGGNTDVSAHFLLNSFAVEELRSAPNHAECVEFTMSGCVEFNAPSDTVCMSVFTANT